MYVVVVRMNTTHELFSTFMYLDVWLQQYILKLRESGAKD